MSALDDYFGDRIRDTSGEVSRKRTAFPRCEERLRPYLDAFLAEVRKITGDDYTPPNVYAVKWVAGARDLAQVLPEQRAAEFMPWAFAKHMRTFPDGRPDSPRSLIYLVERFKPGGGWDSVVCGECFQSPCVCEESET